MKTIDPLTKRDFVVYIRPLWNTMYYDIGYVNELPLEVMMRLDSEPRLSAFFNDDDLHDYWTEINKYELFGYSIKFNGKQFEYRDQLYDSIQDILDCYDNN